MKALTVYSMEGCASCVAAANWLKARGIHHVVVKIEDHPAAWDFLKSEGHRSMPQIYSDGKLFVAGGFQGLVKMPIEAFDSYVGT